MSLSQALQSRKAKVQADRTSPNSYAKQAMPFVSNNANSKSEVWEIGDFAYHKKWGKGTVLEVSGSGKTMELKIKFPEVGLKKLLASVAPIEKVD